MNCHSCPYQAQIDALRRRCLACNPETEAGTPHGAGKVRADEFTLNAVPKAIDFDRTPSGQATNLAEDDEHKLRLAMSSLFGLDPLELLLIQHLMRGETLESFGSVTDTVAKRISRHRGSSRALAWSIKERILRKMPLLTSVLRNNRENDSARRIADELGAS